MRTNLAMRVLMACAANPDKTIKRNDVAAMVGASENHLAQVVNLLSQAGYIHTLRGRTGGFILAKPTNEISIGAVFREFEEVLPFVECFDRSANSCPLIGTCRLKPALDAALTAFYAVLDDVYLDSLVDGNAGLEALLAMPDGVLSSAPCSVKA